MRHGRFIASRRDIVSGMPDADPLTARILATAGTALVRGDLSMEALAEQAGVGRATLYRRFPNRRTLIDGLVDAAIDELATRLREAELGAVPAAVGVERAVRAFLLAAERFPALQSVTKTAAQERRFAQVVIAPIRAVVERGAAAGELASDVDPAIAVQLLGALLATGVSLRTTPGIGVEAATSQITRLFLHGYACPGA
jgi:AcrR family transcriptional regulator